MQPVDIAFFAGSLFLALGTLITWKRRRDLINARVNRGLRGYVDAKRTMGRPVPEETNGANLIAV
jgi:hypothetical protein